MAGSEDSEYTQVTQDELEQLMQLMRSTCDLARVVDPATFEARNYERDETGEGLQQPYRCYAGIKKSRRCQDCISARAVSERKSATKFEFIGDDAFLISARYVEVDGEPRTIETVQRVTDSIGIANGGVESFAQRVDRATANVYRDDVTGAYSRRYFDDGLRALEGYKLALIRIEGLGALGNERGLAKVDEAMRLSAYAIRDCLREEDTLIRYEDDLFAIQFEDMSVEDFEGCLRDIQTRVGSMRMADVPSFVFAASVGAVDDQGVFGELMALAHRMLDHAAAAPDRLAVKGSTYRRADMPTPLPGMPEGMTPHAAAMHDELTGLLSPNAFWKQVQQLIDSQDAAWQGMSVVQFDIVDFKAFNRSVGFLDGDALLCHVGASIARVFEGDPTSRLMADRFAVVTAARDVEERAQRLHDQMLGYRDGEPVELKAGIFVLDGTVSDAAVACDRAKLACDSIKGFYDRTCRRYDAELDAEITMGQYVVGNIDRAIAEGHIKIFYQPIVRASTGHVCDFEALVRWDDPERGLLSPAVFISTLERAHLIHKLDCAVIRQVCRRIALHRNMGLPTVPVSVNLSRLDFQLCDIFRVVDDAVRESGIPRSMLHLEVTESALDKDEAFLKDQLRRLRDAGFEVWMDDFGSGYSSLNLLKDFGFDTLKIDMRFLEGIEYNHKAREIVVSVVDMAKRLGIHTLVEGVETEGQQQFLRRIGCEMLQGYYFDRPRPYAVGEMPELPFESLAERSYYEAIGSVNLLGSRAHADVHDLYCSTETEMRSAPIAIVEYRSGRWSYLTANGEFLSFVHRSVPKDVDAAEGGADAATDVALACIVEQLADDVRPGQERRMSFDLGFGTYVALARHIASGDAADAYLVMVES